MKWGEVRWYTFKEPDKRRPVLILTRNSAINFLNALTIAPITTTVRDIPSEVFLNREDGLFTDCAITLDNLQTVSKTNVGELITRLSSERMAEVKRALVFALGFDSLL
jgi:mRNA interferase MazF